MSEAKRFPRGAVASPHYLASSAGLAVLASGGNALDAAIATNLVLGVVAPYMCGYGGDLLALVYDGELHGYNGSGRSARSATLDAARAAIGSDDMPAVGPHSVTVPGAVEGWFTLLERFGKRSFDELAQTALAYAREGFELSSAIAAHITSRAQTFNADWGAEWRRVYADAGTFLRQPDLARTIEVLCADGPDAYYRGPIARDIGETLEGLGALIGADDLRAYAGDWVRPLSATYRGVDVYELPPNSVGVVALEALNIVEGQQHDGGEAAHRNHILIEAMKLALADRDTYVTDIDHMTLDPAELASKAWADERRDRIDPDRASTPVPGRSAVGGTVYLCVADADGMLVSMIQSNFAGFGSGVTVPGWGINLQNRGAYFSLDPQHVNVIAPAKRTLHTLMPAMAFRDGSPWLVFGTMGGDGQPQTHLQFLTRVIDDGDDIQAAIDAPRWAVEPSDWTVVAEPAIGADVIDELASRGHAVRRGGPNGHAHAIEVRGDGYAAAFDPRSEGAALGL